LQSTFVLANETRFGWDTRHNGLALALAGLGSAVVQGLLVHNMQTAHASLAAHVTPYSRTLSQLGSATGVKAAEMLNQQVTVQAALIAYIDDFKFLLVAILMSLPLLLLVRRPGQIDTAVTNTVVE